ncbi:MAG TPA: helix-turn-helix transcriptional regulator [Gemmatimonadota bacterium]|jgi:tetratricopeptide (TPR) repeat protein
MRDKSFDARAIGRRIQEARGSRSQRELGEQLGYLQPHISRYERGLVPGSFRFLAGLATLLGVDVNWLLTGRAAVAPSTGDGGASDVAEVVRGAVATALRDLGLGGSPRYQAGEAIERLGSLAAWDRLALELPLLVLPLLERDTQVPSLAQGGAAGDPGGAGAFRDRDAAADSSASADGEADPARLLAAVRAAAERGDATRVLDELQRASLVLESTGPAVLIQERVRFLLLWAWLIAELLVARRAEVAPQAARLLFQLARVTRKTGRLDEAERLYTAGLERAESAGERTAAARCHAGLGHLSFERGRFEAARSEYVRVLEIALELGSPELLFFAYLDLAMYYHEHERAFEKAAEYAASGLAIARRESDLEHVALFLNELGLNAMEMGDAEEATARFEETLRLAERIGNARLRALGSINLGELRFRSGELEGAAASLREGRSVAVELGLVWAECQAEILLARCDHERGRTASALERLETVEDRCALHGLAHERELARALEREIRQGMLGKLTALSS